MSELNRISDENRIFLSKSVDADSKNLIGATEKGKHSSERDGFLVAFHALSKAYEYALNVRELISIILEPKEQSTSSNQSMLETTEFKRLAMRFDMLTYEDALLIRVIEIFY